MRATFPVCCASAETLSRKEHGAKSNDSDFSLHVFPLRLVHLTLAPSHLITLSARASTFGGIVKPICLAAFRLMMNSNFVGCSTGRSAGLAPLRILSTYVAARRSKSALAHAVAHKAHRFYKSSTAIYHREPALYREFYNLPCLATSGDGACYQVKKCLSAPLACGLECGLKILGT